MSIHLPTRTCRVASAFLLTGSLALAQATPTTEKEIATPTPSAARMASEKQQDQFPKASGARAHPFGHASGKQAAENVPPTPTTDINPADARVVGSAYAIEAVTKKKHIADVKSEDLTVVPTSDVQGGQTGEKSMQEKGLSHNPASSAKPKE
jgi:hypothetical protein